MDKEIIQKKDWSFEKGYYHLKVKDITECKEKLMTELNITTNMSFLNRLRGRTEPTISAVDAIERVFREYGIEDVWGKEI
jgi:hypothetical protein